jgi:hypothetical protein
MQSDRIKDDYFLECSCGNPRHLLVFSIDEKWRL